jgi:hypothetical protein
MSPIEFFLAIYRYRGELIPQIAILFALGIIISFHAMTNPLFDWLLR